MNAVTSTLGKPSKPGAFKWLIKREFWENRGGFFWAPVITGGIFLVLNLILAVIGSIAARRSMDGGGFVIDDPGDIEHSAAVGQNARLDGLDGGLELTLRDRSVSGGVGFSGFGVQEGIRIESGHGNAPCEIDG